MKTKIAIVTIKFDTTGAIKTLSFRPELQLPCVSNTISKLSNVSNEDKDELLEKTNHEVSMCLCSCLKNVSKEDISYDNYMCIYFVNDKVHEISVEYYLVDKLPVLNN